jgi:hypothetical protein
MSVTANIVLAVVGVVAFVLYLKRRSARLSRED